MDTSTTTHAPTDRQADHRTTAELRAALDAVRAAPDDDGRVEMVVARPGPCERVVLDTGRVTVRDGLVGDDWRRRGGDEANPDAQLTLMNARFLDAVSHGDRERWPWAGDQFIVDLDLGDDNLRAGDRLRLGTALVEVTPKPHTGCAKFVARFGVDAQRLVSQPEGRALRLRGIYVRVVEPGEASPGDAVRKVPA